MTQWLKDYFLSLTAVSFLTAVVKILFSKKKKGVVTFVCGLTVLIVAVTPILQVDFQKIAASISKSQIHSMPELTDSLQQNVPLVASIIKEKTEAYIWDKAGELGLQITEINVETAEQDPPYPISVRIAGAYSKQQRRTLTRWIESELALPESAQEWIWTTEMEEE